MSKTIDNLRDAMFFALEGLKSGEMDIERARAMAEIGQTIINSAKVEVEAMKVAGAADSTFLLPGLLPAGAPRVISQHTGSGTKTVEQYQGHSVTTHRMR